MSSSTEKTYLQMVGLCCATEVALVEKILRQLGGVDDISIIIPTKTVIVLVRLEGSIRHQSEIDSVTKWPLPALTVCGLLFSLSFLKYVYHPLQWLALAAVVIGLPPIAWRSLASIKNLTLNIYVLVLISVAGTLAFASLLASCFHSLPVFHCSVARVEASHKV
ncbi:hypothetical protein NL676_034777 [Syzygium grande]|nr:hypothetical protein NL676_034777 [Syzygium grande]